MLHYDTNKGLDDLALTVSECYHALKNRASEFDSIAVQGTSGLLVGSPLSIMMGKPLVIIRKGEELRCFHSKEVENARGLGKRVLFLDDQISTGRTLEDVKAKVLQHGAEVTASYLYQDKEHDSGVWGYRGPSGIGNYDGTREARQMA